MSDLEPPAWHQALVYALTGVHRPELGRQERPDLDAVLTAVGTGPVGAYVVPPELTRGIGAAQLAAVLTELRRRVAERSSGRAPVLADRPLSADERRLSADVPPHHG